MHLLSREDRGATTSVRGHGVVTIDVCEVWESFCMAAKQAASLVQLLSLEALQTLPPFVPQKTGEESPGSIGQSAR